MNYVKIGIFLFFVLFFSAVLEHISTPTPMTVTVEEAFLGEEYSEPKTETFSIQDVHASYMDIVYEGRDIQLLAKEKINIVFLGEDGYFVMEQLTWPEFRSRLDWAEYYGVTWLPLVPQVTEDMNDTMTIVLYESIKTAIVNPSDWNGMMASIQNLPGQSQLSTFQWVANLSNKELAYVHNVIFYVVDSSVDGYLLPGNLIEGGMIDTREGSHGSLFIELPK